jgi:NitT/TauT family transport system substrate-binding protein
MFTAVLRGSAPRFARRPALPAVTVPVVTVLVVTVLVAALAGCGDGADAGGQGAPANVTEIRVAVSPLASVLPVHVAELNGMFERNGLRIKRTEGQDLPVFAAALTQGDYDIVLSVPTIALVGASRGLDIQVVSRLQRSSAAEPGTVWITKDPSIDSVARLAGKTIAVPALTGQITDSLVYLLQRSGVDRDEVKFVQVPFATMGDQLQAGRVDAVVAPPPFSTALAAQGLQIHDDVVAAAVSAATDGRVEDGMTALFASSTRFAAENPELIRAFRRSLTEAIDYLRVNEAHARTLLQTWLKMPPEVARSTPLPSWEVEITPQDLQPYVTISKAVGTIKREPDVDALVWQDGK